MRTGFATFVTGSYALEREGLCRILSSARFEVTGAVSDVAEIATQIAQEQRPLLMVFISGDEFSTTLGQIEAYRRSRPNDRIAVLARSWRLSDVGAAFAAGANACLSEEANVRALIKSLELVMLGETLFPQDIVDEVFPHDVPETPKISSGETNAVWPSEFGILSERESRILESLKTGDSNKVIARKLGISEATVKVHVKAILRKVRVQNRTQAAFWAMSRAPVPEKEQTPSPPDELTGAASRKAFLAEGTARLAAAARQKAGASLLLMDIDHFKAINDNFGHETGDRVLRIFADCARSVLRPGDLFGRIGGEEFGVLLIGPNETAALAVAERMRRAVETIELIEERTRVALSVSVGLATARGDHPFGDLLREADNALHRAKAAGRNRVEQEPASVRLPGHVLQKSSGDLRRPQAGSAHHERRQCRGP